MWAGTTLSPLSRRVSRADSSVGRNINRPVEEKPLLDEIREVLAQSYLIFLFADLRQMSATGRIGTKYENLAIDNDVCSRHTAKCIACMEDSLEIHEHKKRFSGLSSAVIMAIVILEIRDTFVKTAEENKETGKKGTKKFKFATSVDIDNDDDFVAYENNDLKKKMTEESMESLMRCYSRMISEDLLTDIPHIVQRRESMAPTKSIMNNINNSMGNVFSPTGSISSSNSNSTTLCNANAALNKPAGETGGYTNASNLPKSALGFRDATLGSVEEDAVTDIGSENLQTSGAGFSASAATDIGGGDAISDSKITAGTGASFRPSSESHASTDEQSHKSPMQRFVPSAWHGRGSVSSGGGPPLSRQMSFRQQVKLTRDNSVQIAQRIKTDFNDQVDILLAKNREANTQKEFQELTDVFFQPGALNDNMVSNLGKNVTRKEMVKLMRNAVETRNEIHLKEVLSKLFKPGSISQLLVESHARVVWINDWYPLTDLTYAISVDPLQRRVMVVFRGAITARDWKSAINFKFHKMKNPVTDSFEGRKDFVRVFAGLYTYLFRKRKDTGTTKYDEIANMVHKYGLERIGRDYKLFVTGHSLGGALTHFFSFFASTDKRFTKNGPVKAIAFASPYIGCHSWADSIRHQEREKKLQIVQCRNDSDVIPRLPINLSIGKRGPHWRHVGIGVTLPSLPKCGSRWKPMVHYWGKEKSCLDSTIHGFRRNVLFHMSYLRPWTLDRSHTLFELQDRLMYGEVQKDGGDFELLQSTLDELYESLEEYNYETLVRTTKWWDVIGKKEENEEII